MKVLHDYGFDFAAWKDAIAQPTNAIEENPFFHFLKNYACYHQQLAEDRGATNNKERNQKKKAKEKRKKEARKAATNGK